MKLELNIQSFKIYNKLLSYHLREFFYILCKSGLPCQEESTSMVKMYIVCKNSERWLLR